MTRNTAGGRLTTRERKYLESASPEELAHYTEKHTGIVGEEKETIQERSKEIVEETEGKTQYEPGARKTARKLISLYNAGLLSKEGHERLKGVSGTTAVGDMDIAGWKKYSKYKKVQRLEDQDLIERTSGNKYGIAVPISSLSGSEAKGLRSAGFDISSFDISRAKGIEKLKNMELIKETYGRSGRVTGYSFEGTEEEFDEHEDLFSQAGFHTADETLAGEPSLEKTGQKEAEPVFLPSGMDIADLTDESLAFSSKGQYTPEHQAMKYYVPPEERGYSTTLGSFAETLTKPIGKTYGAVGGAVGKAGTFAIEHIPSPGPGGFRMKYFGPGPLGGEPIPRTSMEIIEEGEKLEKEYSWLPGESEKVVSTGEEFAAGIYSPVSVFVEPSTPELLGAGLEGFSGPKTEFLKEHPAYLAGGLVGEAVTGYMIGKAAEPVVSRTPFVRKVPKGIAKVGRKVKKKTGRVYYKGLTSALGKEPIEELAERPGRTGRILRSISPEWVPVNLPESTGYSLYRFSGETTPREISEEGIESSLRRMGGGVKQTYGRGGKAYIKREVYEELPEKFARLETPMGSYQFIKKTGKEPITEFLPKQTSKGLRFAIQETGEKTAKRAAYGYFQEPVIYGGMSSIVETLPGKVVSKLPQMKPLAVSAKGSEILTKIIGGFGARAVPSIVNKIGIPQLTFKEMEKERVSKMPDIKSLSASREEPKEVQMPRLVSPLDTERKTKPVSDVDELSKNIDISIPIFKLREKEKTEQEVTPRPRTEQRQDIFTPRPPRMKSPSLVYLPPTVPLFPDYEDKDKKGGEEKPWWLFGKRKHELKSPLLIALGPGGPPEKNIFQTGPKKNVFQMSEGGNPFGG